MMETYFEFVLLGGGGLKTEMGMIGENGRWTINKGEVSDGGILAGTLLSPASNGIDFWAVQISWGHSVWLYANKTDGTHTLSEDISSSMNTAQAVMTIPQYFKLFASLASNTCAMLQLPRLPKS